MYLFRISRFIDFGKNKPSFRGQKKNQCFFGDRQITRLHNIIFIICFVYVLIKNRFWALCNTMPPGLYSSCSPLIIVWRYRLRTTRYLSMCSIRTHLSCRLHFYSLPNIERTYNNNTNAALK